MNFSFKKIYFLILPGLLVAATGVGAGDLITASLAAQKLGTTILWAPLIGAILKFSVTESLARFQIATQKTVLEGWVIYLAKWVQWCFLAYLILWSYMVGGALINSTGVAMSALYPIGDIQNSKIVWGIIHSLIGFILALKGSFKLFEKVMSFLIGLMFIIVIGGSLFFIDDLSSISLGFIPHFPKGEISWIIALVGGVGGTLTVLSYGYWIREEKREGHLGLKSSQIDLAVAYFFTALFSIAMIIIGSHLDFSNAPKEELAQLISALFKQKFGSIGAKLFLIGFWAGVTSSLLGVWQGVPYLFADFRSFNNKHISQLNLSQSNNYRYFLAFIAFVPISSFWFEFETIQLAYATFGALFVPFLALSLLILNNKLSIMSEYKNKWLSNLLLSLTLIFFIIAAIIKIFQ